MRLAFLLALLVVATFVPVALGQKTAVDTLSPNPAKSPRLLPGAQPGGLMQLPNQWSLKPTGKQLALGDFPVHIAPHPTENTAAILHAGYGEHEVVIVDLAGLKVISRAAISEAFYGLTFSPDGAWLYASGAGQELVHQFRYEKGYLSGHREIRVASPKEKFVPAGISISAKGDTLFVACAWGSTVCVLPVADPSQPKHIKLTEDDYPYATLPSPDGKRLFVSLWGRSAVAVVNLETEQVETTWTVDSHPTEMLFSPDRKLLYVACANSNSVHVIDIAASKTLEVIRSSLYSQADNGSTPNSLALSPDGKVLLIANADNNNVAVIDVSSRGHSRSLGFIPVGWYPTSVRFGGGEKDWKILVANGKGLMSKSNRNGPTPDNEPPATLREYIGGLFRGTLSAIDSPSPADMAKYTRAAFECSPLREDKAPRTNKREDNNPIPAKVGDPSPIKHCIYVIKENRTYDQVFGDMPQGNGDPSLCIFGEKVTPNHHALAREFVLLDNFYVESEVSADGHEWSMAAYASDFVEKTWPLLYRGSREGKLKYPSEGSLKIAWPSSGYIWDRCKEAGVTYRSYGEFIAEPSKTKPMRTAKVPTLAGHFDPDFHGYDLDYPDVKRTARFLEELRRFEKEGEMPRFMIVRLPNDHTQGTIPGKPTPTAMVADNDLALGQLIEGISQSKFWKDTAVFVIQDDAQNGSDHVDAHRTVALVVSPYTKRGFVDSHMYSTASMLRTMELILGLKPMTQFDAAALPMYHSFRAPPDLTPFQHRPAQVDLTAQNAKTAWGAELSLKFDFSKEDAADDLLLNEVVWRSVRGPQSRMPAPVRASFIYAVPEEEEDEDDDDEEMDEAEGNSAASTEQESPITKITAPPAKENIPEFYAKYVHANGYPIVASSRVNDYAVYEAAYLVNKMLAHRPDVRRAMIESGSRMCILAHNEFTTDLPEFKELGTAKGKPDQKAKDYWDARARGTGGSETDPYCSCGEENLLGYAGDPYAAECILIHEFAHNIHLRGMVRVDPTFDKRLKETYDAAMKQGLWKGAYASTNHHEYFAEGVQSWFDNNRENDHDHNHVNTRAELQEHDPGLAAICREVFGETKLVYTKPATRLTGHMAGYDPRHAPTFVWPDHLREVKAEIRRKAEERSQAAKGESRSKP